MPWCLFAWALTSAWLGLLVPLAAARPPQQPAPKGKLPRPRRLDRDLKLGRDSATGELRGPSPPDVPAPGTIRAQVRLVEVACNAFAAGGAPLRGLAREDFRLFEGGVEQAIAHWDASGRPASIALVFDASPSVFRELAEMKAAARTLAKHLAADDEVAVVAFAGETQLLLPFSRDRALLERAIASPALSQVADSKESNIYRAVYLAARALFGDPPRPGRKAMVLLTDGQDSGLGLRWDPASMLPQPAETSARLTFEDVSRALAAAGVELYAVSTQPRPRAMTEAWLAARRSEMLVTPEARELGMPHYTLYLAELVRRAGGKLFFLREAGTLGEVYRSIAENLGAQYTLGYYPRAGLFRPGWRSLRVELRPEAPGAAGVRLAYRVSYYVPAAEH